MTQPPEPTPGAPADPSTPQPVVPAPEVPEPIQPFDPTSLTPEARAYLKAQIDAADLKARTTSKANAADEARREMAAQVAKALGLGGDEPPDPEALTAQIEQAQAEAWRNGVELQVSRIAARLGADMDALLDSNSFLDTLDDLVDEDPRSPDFAASLEAKVQEALAKYPHKYRANGQAPSTPAAPRPDPSQGSRGPAPAKRASSLREAIDKHYSSGR